jgi:hypothetical protein
MFSASGRLVLLKRKFMSGEGPVIIDFTGSGWALDAIAFNVKNRLRFLHRIRN